MCDMVLQCQMPVRCTKHDREAISSPKSVAETGAAPALLTYRSSCSRSPTLLPAGSCGLRSVRPP